MRQHMVWLQSHKDSPKMQGICVGQVSVYPTSVCQISDALETVAKIIMPMGAAHG